MRTQFDPNQPVGFSNDYPGAFIGNWENAVIRTLADFKGIFAQPVRHFLRYEYQLVLLPFLRLSWATPFG